MSFIRSSNWGLLLPKSTGIVPEEISRAILMDCGLPIAPFKMAQDIAQVIKYSTEIGYPVVLKVNSPLIIHKTDSGGVHLNLKDQTAVENAYSLILRSFGASTPDFKVIVEKMYPPGIEVIIGVSRDEQFGPVIMFGIGGIFVELFDDVVFRLIPLNELQASQMVSSIKAYPVLSGYRGKPAVDVQALQQILLTVSDLIDRFPQISELDLNPVILYPDRAVIVDARMVVQAN